jgi:two-component system, sensor histidine kinase PdtaS
MSKVKILLVEQDKSEAKELGSMLKLSGYDVPYIVSTCDEAVEQALKKSSDLVLMNVASSGEIDCSQAASRIKKLNIPIIYLSVSSEKSQLTEPYGYITKPYDSNQIKYVVELALYKNMMDNKLKESEKRCNDLINNSMVGIYKTNMNGDIIFANNAMAEIFDFKGVDELKRKRLSQLYKDQADWDLSVEKLRKDGSFTHMEVQMISDRDKPITILLSSYIGADSISGMMMDISKRKDMEDALRESEEKYRTLFEQDPYFNMILGIDGTILDVNNTITDIMGLSKENIIGTNFSELENIPSEDVAQYESKIKSLLKGEHVEPFESHFKDIYGGSSWVLIHLKAIMDNGNISYILAIGGDITQRKLAENEIKSSLVEKNTLLQEIHHRVKNNMQIISSLLNLQIKYVDDGKAVDVLKESQNRVKSMAMIHDKLYMSEDLTRINFVEYINSLVSNLFYSYNIDEEIKPILKIDNLSLNMETAVPCGLIISELVSNSLKYAFPDGMIGEIFISLKSDGDDYELIIGDNGIGLSEEFDIKNTKTLGLMLVTSLTEQIDGKISINRDHGTRYTIVFKESVYKDRI